MNESLCVRTSLGDLQGFRNGDMLQFRGIPYAQAPIGELRFQAPVPLFPWSNLRDAHQHGPISPQPPSRLREVIGDYTRSQSEDCLSLTVSTPALDPKALPVLVWLHGGAYSSGAGSLDFYDGITLARQGNMVVVGVNYRLGALGFLYQPGISMGKQGLLDVIAALEWVHSEIAVFGGDPERVTIAGQSAGAHIIMCLLSMPATHYLYRRAILQSVPAGLAPLSQAVALHYGHLFVDFLDLEQEQLATQLKAVTTEQIIEATAKTARATARFGQISPQFLPMIDELSTPERFIDAAATGAAKAGIDIIIGTTREEANAFFLHPLSPEPDPALVAEQFALLVGSEASMDQYRLRRPEGSIAELLSDLITDTMFLFPSHHLAEVTAALGCRTWMYQFDWAPVSSPLKACHCLELPFVFGNRDAWSEASMLNGISSTAFQGISDIIQDFWSSFVHDGVPAGPLPWPRYQASDRQVMRFADIIGPVGDPAGVSWRNLKSM